MPITKKHKSILFSGIALMAGATLLAGCSADPLPVSKSEQYTRDFIKTFGAFDQSHDWNHATQATVTVTTPAPTEVKIMADFEGKRYIFATYTNVEGTKTLNVDIPKGISDLIVAANGKNYSVKAGGEVDTSKAARSSRAESNDGFSAYVNEDYRCIPTEVVESYTRKLPEGVNNFTAEEVSYNYSFISDGKPFTFYPIFWYTASRHHLGIYWYDKGHYGEAEYYHEQEVYMSKTGLLQYYTEETWPGKFTLEEDVLIEGTGTEEKWGNESELYPKIKAENLKSYLPSDYTEISGEDSEEVIAEKNRVFKEAAEKCFNAYYKKALDKEINSNPEYYIGKVVKSYKTTEGANAYSQPEMTLYIAEYTPGIPAEYYTPGEYEGDPTKWALANEQPSHPGSSPYIRTKGITVNLPEGTQFGLYIDVTGSIYDPKIYHRCYSSARLNKSDPNSIFNTDKENNGYQSKPDATTTGWNLNDSKTGVHQDGNFTTASYFHTTTTVGECDVITRTFFSFEDWGTQAADFNDILFMVDEQSVPDDDEFVDEDKPKPEPEEWQWIIACEDLGTNDFDFNDVVFSVSAVTTEGEGDDMKSYVKVKALASGGTLPVYVYFEKDGVRKRIAPEGTDAEFHKWFGDHHHSKVINASSFRAEGKTARIEVPNGFTMACNEKDNMGGFAVGVIYPDKEEIIEASSPGTINSNKNPELIGKAPQMICVPYSWYWPTENTFIVDVYEGFTGWCKDPENNGHWHKNPKGNYWQ